MRVIAGICRGMKLVSPPGNSTRPTSGRVKEALFNIIANRLSFDGARVLDICAGVGALGIEALSRGASSCSFVENDRKVIPYLEKNLEDPRIKNRAEIFPMDAIKALSLFALRGRKYDILFLDPPYASDLYTSVFESLGSLEILDSNVMLAAESSIHYPLPEMSGPLLRIDRRVYGDTVLEFFALEGT